MNRHLKNNSLFLAFIAALIFIGALLFYHHKTEQHRKKRFVILSLKKDDELTQEERIEYATIYYEIFSRRDRDLFY